MALLKPSGDQSDGTGPLSVTVHWLYMSRKCSFFFFSEHTKYQVVSWLPVPDQVTVYAPSAMHQNIPTHLTGFWKARVDLNLRVVFALSIKQLSWLFDANL